MDIKPLSMLVETASNIEPIRESIDGKQKLYIEGIFAEAELKNGNGRFYPLSVLTDAVNNFNANFIERKVAIGELNHPDYPLPDPAKAAIFIESLRMEGTKAIGKALVMTETDGGRQIKALLDAGYAMGVSTRGLGSIKEKNGLKIVEEGFMLTSVDCVSNPSGPNCYVNAIKESIQKYAYIDGSLVEISENIKDKPDQTVITNESVEKLVEYFKSLK